MQAQAGLAKASVKLITANTTLKYSDFAKTGQIMVTGNYTVTLPTPSENLLGKKVTIFNNHSGSISVSCTGMFLRNANSISVASASAVNIECCLTAVGTYRWGYTGKDGAAFSAPTGTGYMTVTGGVMDAAASAANVVASGAEVDTGTDNVKYVTAKAIEDSSYIKSAALPVKATSGEVNTGTDDAKFVTALALANSNYATLDEVSTPTPVQLGASITACSAKATPLLADSLAISDSADGGIAKESTLTQVSAVLLGAVNLGDAVTGLAAKATPVDADELLVADSAATNDAKKSTVAQLRSTLLSADAFGTVMTGYAAKATPIDADEIAIVDTADTNDAKKSTVAQLRTTVLGADPFGTVMVGYTEKATPVDADVMTLADSAATNDAKKCTVAQLRAGMLTADTLGGLVHGMAAKATPVDADELLLVDSADTNDAKMSTVAQLRTTLVSADAFGTVINGYAAKATPVAADMFVIADSADTNDAKKVTFTQLQATLGIAAVATFTPSLTWAGGAPTVVTTVYREQTINKVCHWRIRVAGTNGNNATTLTVDFPAALVPTDVDLIVACPCQVSQNAGAWTAKVATLDCAAAAGGDRQLVIATGTLTDTEAFDIIVSGSHEIA